MERKKQLKQYLSSFFFKKHNTVLIERVIIIHFTAKKENTH